MEKQSFFKWILQEDPDVTPISWGWGLLIGIICAGLDEVLPVTLLIVSTVFMLFKHRRMALFLMALNLIPDALPIVDEIGNVFIDFTLAKMQFKTYQNAFKAVKFMQSDAPRLADKYIKK